MQHAATVFLLPMLGLLLAGFTFDPDTPENQGMTSAGLAALVTYSDGFHANSGLMVLRNDKVVLEHYTGTGNETKKFAIKSATNWLIDVWGTATLLPVNETGKLARVNTGCGDTGCNGTIGYNNGYPHPLRRTNPEGSGDCPNGLTLPASDGTEATFCYTSIENALGDVVTSTSNHGDCPAPYCPHSAPPFIHLSASGWQNPPSGTNPQPPLPIIE